MKTSTPEVLCDACQQPIPVMHPTALFLTMKGPRVGHKKVDLCDEACLSVWAEAKFQATTMEARVKP